MGSYPVTFDPCLKLLCVGVHRRQCCYCPEVMDSGILHSIIIAYFAIPGSCKATAHSCSCGGLNAYLLTVRNLRLKIREANVEIGEILALNVNLAPFQRLSHVHSNFLMSNSFFATTLCLLPFAMDLMSIFSMIHSLAFHTPLMC